MSENKSYFKLDFDDSSIYCFPTWYSRSHNLAYFYIVTIAGLTNGTYISPPTFQGPFVELAVREIRGITKVINADRTSYGSVLINNFDKLDILNSVRLLEFVPFGITTFEFSVLATLGALSETLPDYGDYFGLKN
jgi:hypothetical protein